MQLKSYNAPFVPSSLFYRSICLSLSSKECCVTKGYLVVNTKKMLKISYIQLILASAQMKYAQNMSNWPLKTLTLINGMASNLSWFIFKCQQKRFEVRIYLFNHDDNLLNDDLLSWQFLFAPTREQLLNSMCQLPIPISFW